MLDSLKAAMIGILLMLTLAACSSSGADLATQCMFEVNAPGSYTFPAGQSAPVVTPGAGGTAEGAAAINACVQTRASLAASGATAPRPATVETQDVSTAGSYSVRTYTYGTPPATAGSYRATPQVRVLRPGCSPDSPKIYRGSLYC